MGVIAIPEEIAQLRESLESFVEREVGAAEESIADELRRTGTVDHDTFVAAQRELRKKSVAAGFYAMHMPEDVGGAGLGSLGMAIAHEVIAASGYALAERGSVIAGVEGPTHMLLDLNDEQRVRYLEPLMRAEREACFALSEPEAGSDATNIHTKARRDGDGWVIDGRKHFITHGQYADVIQLFATTDAEKGAAGGITFFMVDKDTPGVSVTSIQHTIGSDLPAELTFEGARVGDEQVVGEVGFGFRSAMRWINKGRIDIGGSAIGKATWLTDRMRDYARERTAFGRPIGNFQFVQQHVVDSFVELRMARNLVYECADAVDRGEDPRQAAAMAKLAATEMVGRVADRAIQVFGGNGIMSELGVERVYRDVRAMRVYEGTSEILRETIAKTLGLT